MPLTLTCKITALTPDGSGYETDIPNGDGSPFLYYPRYNEASPAMVGKTLTVTYASETVTYASEMVRTSERVG